MKGLLNCRCCSASRGKKRRQKKNKSSNFSKARRSLKDERWGCMFRVARCKSPTSDSVSLQIEISQQTLKEVTEVRFSRTSLCSSWSISLSQPDVSRRDTERLPPLGSRQKSASPTFSGHLTQIPKQSKDTIIESIPKKPLASQWLILIWNRTQLPILIVGHILDDSNLKHYLSVIIYYCLRACVLLAYYHYRPTVYLQGYVFQLNNPCIIRACWLQKYLGLTTGHIQEPT